MSKKVLLWLMKYPGEELHTPRGKIYFNDEDGFVCKKLGMSEKFSIADFFLEYERIDLTKALYHDSRCTIKFNAKNNPSAKKAPTGRYTIIDIFNYLSEEPEKRVLYRQSGHAYYINEYGDLESHISYETGDSTNDCFSLNSIFLFRMPNELYFDPEFKEPFSLFDAKEQKKRFTVRILIETDGDAMLTYKGEESHSLEIYEQVDTKHCAFKILKAIKVKEGMKASEFFQERIKEILVNKCIQYSDCGGNCEIEFYINENCIKVRK